MPFPPSQPKHRAQNHGTDELEENQPRRLAHSKRQRSFSAAGHLHSSPWFFITLANSSVCNRTRHVSEEPSINNTGGQYIFPEHLLCVCCDKEVEWNSLAFSRPHCFYVRYYFSSTKPNDKQIQHKASSEFCLEKYMSP